MPAKKEAGPVVVLAEVGRNEHDLGTSLYNDLPSPRTWSPSPLDLAC